MNRVWLLVGLLCACGSSSGTSGTIDASATDAATSDAATSDAPRDAPAPIAPIAADGALTVEVGGTATGQLVGTDANADALTYRVVTPPTKGTVTLDAATGAYTYTTPELTATTDSFTFQVNDGTADAPAAATVAITVTPFDFSGQYALTSITKDGQPCEPTTFTIDHAGSSLVIGDRVLVCGATTTTFKYQRIDILPDRTLQSQGFTIGALSDAAIAIDSTRAVSGCGTVRLQFALARTTTGFTYSESTQIPCLGNDVVAATVTYAPRARLALGASVYRTPPTRLGTPATVGIEVVNTGKIATALTPQPNPPFAVTAASTCGPTLAAGAACTYAVDASAGPAGCYGTGFGVAYTDGLTSAASTYLTGCVSPVLVAPTQVAVGTFHVCALHAGGVSCYGDNTLGQTTVPTLTNVVQIVAGSNHTCARRTTGTTCWGDNTYGQLNVPGVVSAIALGYAHTCTILNGAVQCYGNNSDNQVYPIPAMTAPTALAAEGGTTCALDGAAVRCWGNTTVGRATPPVTTSPTAITVGSDHACVLDAGVVRCWGTNTYGELTVPALTNARAVIAANHSTCAIDDAGVRCWGYNGRGETEVPALVAPVTLVDGGERFCAIDATGLLCW